MAFEDMIDILPVIENEQDLLDMIKEGIISNFDTPLDETVQDNMYNHKNKALAIRENYYFMMELMGKNTKRGQVQLSTMGNQTGLNPNYKRAADNYSVDKFGNIIPSEGLA